MRIGIIQFPGSNCERETILAVKRAGMVPVEFLWNESAQLLEDMDGYIIPGGFSYEDRSRAGIIASLHPVMETIKTQSQLGKPILGICNGAQILLESGMVPGNGESIALTDNRRMKDNEVLGTGYYNAWVQIKQGNNSQHNAFTRHLDGTCIRMPVAHAQGRFLADDQTAAILEKQGLIAFQYCDINGQIIDSFPVNPNGSVRNIAALTNPAGNIMAIMPHPERTHMADALLKSMRDYIANGFSPIPQIEPKKTELTIKPFEKNPGSHSMVVELIIADNHALTVQRALQKLGFPVSVKRQIYWEIACGSQSVFHQIQASGILYNERKSFLATHIPKPNQCSLLVMPKDDMTGLQKKQQIIRHFDIQDVQNIKQGVLWHIESEIAISDKALEKILQSAILFNPISHECYHYE